MKRRRSTSASAAGGATQFDRTGVAHHDSERVVCGAAAGGCGARVGAGGRHADARRRAKQKSYIPLFRGTLACADAAALRALRRRKATTRYGTRLRCCRRARRAVPMSAPADAACRASTGVLQPQRCALLRLLRRPRVLVDCDGVLRRRCAAPRGARRQRRRLTRREARRLDARRPQCARRAAFRGANSLRVPTVPAGACAACAGQLRRALS